jgi:hypothetical protein
MLLQIMAMAMTKLPPGTPLARAVSKAHFDIGKEIEPGAASQAGVSNAFKSMAMQQNRMAPQNGAMATQMGAPGGAPAQPRPPM